MDLEPGATGEIVVALFSPMGNDTSEGIELALQDVSSPVFKTLPGHYIGCKPG
jgi:hypothetical protein